MEAVDLAYSLNKKMLASLEIMVAREFAVVKGRLQSKAPGFELGECLFDILSKALSSLLYKWV